MARLLRVLISGGLAVALGGLAGCATKTGGPSDPEQEKQFREKAKQFVPSGGGMKAGPKQPATPAAEKENVEPLKPPPEKKD